jgi:hypothetical protein
MTVRPDNAPWITTRQRQSSRQRRKGKGGDADEVDDECADGQDVRADNPDGKSEQDEQKPKDPTWPMVAERAGMETRRVMPMAGEERPERTGRTRARGRDGCAQMPTETNKQRAESR